MANNIFFQPFVGKHYADGGMFGKRIMILGESHYCDEECTDCGDCRLHRECMGFTQNVLADYLDETNERQDWMRTFVKFERPGITVKVDGKSYKSNPVALKVITCDVDTLNMDKFFPPKSVQDNPFLWSEWTPLIWMTLIVLLLIALGSWVIVRLKQNKPIVARIRIVKKVPPHKKALDEMNRLKGESHTADYDQKAYYTQLTDTLRQYIRERFGFNAMEMTSSEILENLRSAGDERMLAELSELFMTADLVKFAKYSALLNEKDMNLLNAINFIDQTKREDAPTEERIEPTLSEEEVRTRKTRVALNTLLGAIAVAVVALAGYVVYRVWLLLM